MYLKGFLGGILGLPTLAVAYIVIDALRYPGKLVAWDPISVRWRARDASRHCKDRDSVSVSGHSWRQDMTLANVIEIAVILAIVVVAIRFFVKRG